MDEHRGRAGLVLKKKRTVDGRKRERRVRNIGEMKRERGQMERWRERKADRNTYITINYFKINRIAKE